MIVNGFITILKVPYNVLRSPFLQTDIEILESTKSLKDIENLTRVFVKINLNLSESILYINIITLQMSSESKAKKRRNL